MSEKENARLVDGRFLVIWYDGILQFPSYRIPQ